MTEHEIARALWLRAGRDASATSPLAKALLAWSRSHQAWLTGEPADRKLGWTRAREALGRAAPRAEAPDRALEVAEALTEALALSPFDAVFLRLVAAVERHPRLAALAKVIVEDAADLPSLLAELAGAEEPAREVRASAALRLGLVYTRNRGEGGCEIGPTWTLNRILDRATDIGDGLIDLLAGKRQAAVLTLDDYAEHRREADFLVALLAGAARERAAGVNILIHGPPGVGKTELARVLAEAAGLVLHSVGEADPDGDEPTRWDRVTALQLAQKTLARRGGALLFDEFEDVIGGARPTAGGWMAGREGSKVFLNRLLEANPAPVIWTTNAVGNLDPAILRRFSYVLEVGLPSRRAGRRILARIAADEGVAAGPPIEGLVDRAPEAATVLRVAAQAGRLAGVEDGTALAAGSLVRALRGGARLPDALGEIDLELYETDLDLGRLVERISDADAPADVSLLLTGPPGTGKTELAHHLARRMDRPLIVKRASDLLSKWVGESEKLIAGAFEEARRSEGVLLFDEVDSLLYNRASAERSWEVTQVNELLTWLDRHPLPFVAATNHAERLDPAALRRFVFKLELRPLTPAKAERAFARFFGAPAPRGLAGAGALTAGDFAVVARQLRHADDVSPPAILARLAAEAGHRSSRGRIGF